MSRMRSRIQRQALAAEHVRLVEKALGEAAGSGRPAPIASNGGDEERLRGIPAIGRGVSGAIRGTQPDRRVR